MTSCARLGDIELTKYPSSNNTNRHMPKFPSIPTSSIPSSSDATEIHDPCIKENEIRHHHSYYTTEVDSARTENKFPASGESCKHNKVHRDSSEQRYPCLYARNSSAGERSTLTTEKYSVSYHTDNRDRVPKFFGTERTDNKGEYSDGIVGWEKPELRANEIRRITPIGPIRHRRGEDDTRRYRRSSLPYYDGRETRNRYPENGSYQIIGRKPRYITKYEMSLLEGRSKEQQAHEQRTPTISQPTWESTVSKQSVTELLDLLLKSPATTHLLNGKPIQQNPIVNNEESRAPGYSTVANPNLARMTVAELLQMLSQQTVMRTE